MANPAPITGHARRKIGAAGDGESYDSAGRGTSTLTSMANLASTYRNLGQWEEAEELEVQVMETRRRVLGEEHDAN